ncbi:hypothetical protein [Streptococcus suis]|uniref:hypothetical protein n=1 Tax=Streptococcus suis TaxID=1307 RepID=UPI002118281B|nr:hypothetical protein [Streptococcus suis]MCQ8263473.1 hypothetical protein [Streptococcus suis]
MIQEEVFGTKDTLNYYLLDTYNDVGKTKVTSFMDEMSPEDARRYEQWNKLVADGLDPEQRMWIQDFGTPNTYFEFKKHNPSQNISE